MAMKVYTGRSDHQHGRIVNATAADNESLHSLLNSMARSQRQALTRAYEHDQGLHTLSALKGCP